MAVGNNTIIRKMMNELQQANEHLSNQKVMRRHIENVRLLCDLMIEEGLEAEHQSEVMKEMIPDRQIKHPNESKEIDHDGANGESIFDF